MKVVFTFSKICISYQFWLHLDVPRGASKTLPTPRKGEQICTSCEKNRTALDKKIIMPALAKKLYHITKLFAVKKLYCIGVISAPATLKTRKILLKYLYN
jgi:hypothetical protein